MSNLTVEDIIRFLKINQQLLNSNDFDTLYDVFMEDHLPKQNSILTKVLIDAGINPLNYMAQSVGYMFLNANIDEVNIPNICREIFPYTFEGFEGTSIKFPYGVPCRIYAEGVSYCDRLTDIWLGVDTKLVPLAFYGSNAIETIHFSGSEQQWEYFKRINEEEYKAALETCKVEFNCKW